MHATFHETYRRGLTYVVIFGYADDKATVYSVFHTSQDPAKWRRRLP